MLFNFWRRSGSAPVLEREPDAVGAPPGERAVVDEAIKLIQRHVDKEAQNRRVRELPIRDLCPMQKAELVQDLAKLLR
jgi:hypothetical protein